MGSLLALSFQYKVVYNFLCSCVSTLIFLSVYLNVGSINAGFVEKYFLEAFYSRLMWGLGLLFFILIVIIPFYVMVMTSLKNQQSLLRNPLDFSIDFSLGPEKIFNSYIELFLKYDFLTLLINSSFCFNCYCHNYSSFFYSRSLCYCKT